MPPESASCPHALNPVILTAPHLLPNCTYGLIAFMGPGIVPNIVLPGTSCLTDRRRVDVRARSGSLGFWTDALTPCYMAYYKRVQTFIAAHNHAVEQGATVKGVDVCALNSVPR